MDYKHKYKEAYDRGVHVNSLLNKCNEENKRLRNHIRMLELELLKIGKMAMELGDE